LLHMVVHVKSGKYSLVHSYLNYLGRIKDDCGFVQFSLKLLKKEFL